MSLHILLFILFCGLTLSLWTLLRFSLQGFGRYEAAFTEQAETKFEKLFLFIDSRKIFFINVFALLILPGLIYLVFESLFYVTLGLVALFTLPKISFILLESKRSKQINAALPDTLAQLAGAMRAGSTFLTAIETMVDETKGPIAQEFSLLLRELRLGTTLDEALDNLGERVQAVEMDLVITAAQVSREIGGNLAEIFESLSITLRRKMDMEGKIESLTAQGKLQGWVVGLLPFGIILALVYVEPEGIQPIFTSLLGWIFLSVILLLELLGGLMIRKIVSIDV